MRCYVYFVDHELLPFNHSHLVVLSVVIIIASMAFLSRVPFKQTSARALHRDLAYHPFFFFFGISAGVHHIYTSFVHEPLLRVPPIELSILISIFSLFRSKILIYLGIMMFGQYGPGISIFSLTHPIVPRLSPVREHLVCSFGLSFTPVLTNLVKFFC